MNAAQLLSALQASSLYKTTKYPTQDFLEILDSEVSYEAKSLAIQFGKAFLKIYAPGGRLVDVCIDSAHKDLLLVFLRNGRVQELHIPNRGTSYAALFEKRRFQSVDPMFKPNNPLVKAFLAKIVPMLEE